MRMLSPVHMPRTGPLALDSPYNASPAVISEYMCLEDPAGLWSQTDMMCSSIEYAGSCNMQLLKVLQHADVTSKVQLPFIIKECTTEKYNLAKRDRLKA